MDIQEILAQLERNEGHLPRVALEEAVAHREEIIPHLSAVLEEVARDPQPFASDQNRMIHLYAMYLLAQFREPRAYPLLVQIFSAPGELPHDLAGDVVTEDLGSILASVSDGDPAGMMALVENEQANEWVRGAALDGLVTLVACGMRSREEVMAYFTRLFHTLERKPSAVWDSLANSCADLWPKEVMKDLRRAYEEGLIDPGSIAWGDVREALDRGQAAALKEVRSYRKLIANTVDEIKWWACFHEDEKGWKEEGEAAGDLEDDYEDSFFPLLGRDPGLPTPYQRTEPKVGRNDPCPCGSGKKYKKCCGRAGASSGLS